MTDKNNDFPCHCLGPIVGRITVQRIGRLL